MTRSAIRIGLAATLLAALAPAASLQAAAPPRGSVDEVIARLRVQEAPAPIRANPRWQAPRKVLLLAFGAQWDGRVPALQAAMPGARMAAVGTMAEAIREAPDADVIVGFNPDICSPQLLAAAKQLRWLQSLNAGVELCMRVPEIRQPNLLVTNMRGVDSPAIAEHTIGLVLAMAHGLDVFAKDTAAGTWSRENAAQTRIQMLDGKTMLVVGLGSIGTEVAERAHALGMRIVATRQGEGPTYPFVERIAQPREMMALARTADVIVSAVPLTPETTGMYNRAFFGELKPNALFVNVARGPSVVTDDLVWALNERKIAGAALDVVDPEPLPPGHPLWKAPRVLISPHISGRTDLPGNDRWTLLGENLRRYAEGGPMLQVVDVARGY